MNSERLERRLKRFERDSTILSCEHGTELCFYSGRTRIPIESHFDTITTDIQRELDIIVQRTKQGTIIGTDRTEAIRRVIGLRNYLRLIRERPEFRKQEMRTVAGYFPHCMANSLSYAEISSRELLETASPLDN